MKPLSKIINDQIEGKSMTDYHYIGCQLTTDPCQENQDCYFCRVAHNYENSTKIKKGISEEMKAMQAEAEMETRV